MLHIHILVKSDILTFMAVCLDHVGYMVQTIESVFLYDYSYKKCYMRDRRMRWHLLHHDEYARRLKNEICSS